jgi:hypothetical protein
MMEVRSHCRLFQARIQLPICTHNQNPFTHISVGGELGPLAISELHAKRNHTWTSGVGRGGEGRAEQPPVRQ